MFDWIKKTGHGVFICLFCGNLALQVGQNWVCADKECAKHDDLPPEEQKGFAGWVNPEPTVFTASGTTTNLLNGSQLRATNTNHKLD